MVAIAALVLLPQLLAERQSHGSLLMQMSSVSHKFSAEAKNPCIGCTTCAMVPNPTQGGLSDDACAACATGQTWWPCNADPPQCECKDGSGDPTQVEGGSTAAPKASTSSLEPVSNTYPPVTYPPVESDLCKGCSGCLFGNGACYTDATQAYCQQWSSNVWCQSSIGSDGSVVTPVTHVNTAVPAQPTAGPQPATTEAPSPAVQLPPSGDVTIDTVIDALKRANSNGVFLYETASSNWEPSDLYTWADMTDAVYKMATSGVGKLKLWMGGDNHVYGLVNIAAFLAQVMQETIRYNACDENNWSDLATMSSGAALVAAVYPATAACGQLHQSYQHYQCTVEEDALAGGQMACDVDPNMELRAMTRASWYGSPPELFCAPRSRIPKAPRWSTGGWCSPEERSAFKQQGTDQYFDYVNTGGKCKDYEGQKAGFWTFEGDHCTDEGCANMAAPQFNNTPARTDVEGCCWWGRGAIQTTGICNFGKLNFYMGKRAADAGRDALYPGIDFCKNPGSICEGPPELKWVAGFFYWLNAVQPYTSGGWVYADQLKSWVDGGRDRTDNAFIDGASGIVNRGCHNPDCGTGHLHAKTERRNNFYKVLDAMGL